MAPCRRSTVVVFEISTAGQFNEAQRASGGKTIGLLLSNTCKHKVPLQAWIFLVKQDYSGHPCHI
jgi:hypothetical protein